uniref:Uncharacterized protein n=1 Tax=Romanomermis culicivorax TaxID=13658 RepID=A0A915K0Y4_ROMCU
MRRHLHERVTAVCPFVVVINTAAANRDVPVYQASLKKLSGQRQKLLFFKPFFGLRSAARSTTELSPEET